MKVGDKIVCIKAIKGKTGDHLFNRFTLGKVYNISMITNDGDVIHLVNDQNGFQIFLKDEIDKFFQSLEDFRNEKIEELLK